MKITAANELSPDFRSELAACWRHPSSRVVNTLTNFPTRHILHYFSLVFEILLPLLDESLIFFSLQHWQYSRTGSIFFFFQRPSDLVALADLVHAPRESSEGGEENGHGAGAFAGDPASVPDRSEPARRRAVLEDRHVLHAGHAGLIPDHRLRHFRRSLISLSL